MTVTHRDQQYKPVTVELAKNLADTPESNVDILAGDTVEVEAHNGGAFLKLECQAETGGAVGEIVALRNPVSRQLLRARALGPGKATVDPAPRPALNAQPEQELAP